MRVAIDARWIFPQISGIGAFTRELIAHLPRVDTENEYLILFSDPELRDRTWAETGLQDHTNVSAALAPGGVFSLENQLKTPAFLKRHGVDVYHSTNYAIPYAAFPRDRCGRIACVVTIHDVIPLKFPEFTPRSRKNRVLPLYRALMREVGRRADIIAADSECSAKDVLEHLAIPPHRADDVRTVYCGVADRFTPADKDVSGERRILYVGRADPYKNLTGLVRAFAKASSTGLDNARLVIAGAPDERYPEAPALAADLGVADRIEWTGYLSEEGLLQTYQRSHLVVLPSRYEGFGLPVAEGMATGTPVIASDCGSLPEVAGDAAHVRAPDDIDGMADSIVQILTDPTEYARLQAAGLEHVKQFTWDRAARKMVEIYTRLAQRRPS